MLTTDGGRTYTVVKKIGHGTSGNFNGEQLKSALIPHPQPPPTPNTHTHNNKNTHTPPHKHIW